MSYENQDGRYQQVLGDIIFCWFLRQGLAMHVVALARLELYIDQVSNQLPSVFLIVPPYLFCMYVVCLWMYMWRPEISVIFN